jgi:hypothetical protein
LDLFENLKVGNPKGQPIPNPGTQPGAWRPNHYPDYRQTRNINLNKFQEISLNLTPPSGDREINARPFFGDSSQAINSRGCGCPSIILKQIGVSYKPFCANIFISCVNVRQLKPLHFQKF